MRGALAAENVYKLAVTDAAAKGRYGKGVTAAGDQAWQQGAIDKGVGRYGSGVAAGQAKYEQRIGKFLQLIQATALPPRGPKGSPGNFQRVQVMAEALRKAAQS